MDFAFHFNGCKRAKAYQFLGFSVPPTGQKTINEMGLANAALEPWGDFGVGWEQNKCYMAVTTVYYFPVVAIPRAWTGKHTRQKAISSDVIIINAKILLSYSIITPAK